MPELPEVETVARQVAERVIGLKLIEVVVSDSKLDADYRSIADTVVTDCYRRGKEIVLEFANVSLTTGQNRHESEIQPDVQYLAIHLRMTGRLIWEPQAGKKNTGITANYIHQTQAKSPRVVLVFPEGRLGFYDTRRFGTVALYRTKDSLSSIGVEPLSAEFSLAALRKLLEGRSTSLKNFLLRQDLIVGIGNIYAAEILFDAGLSPLRSAGSLSSKENAKLRSSTVRILKKAIENCGTSFSDFQQADGELGSYQNFLQVYGKEGEGCRSCGREIMRVAQSGRSTFYCANCQS